MKEINQKMLDELAEKMPTIDEADEGKYSGGTFYIDYHGGTFGRVGPTDRLALLGSQQMYDYAREHELEDYGIDLYKATDDYFPPGSVHYGEHVQKNVFSNYAKWIINYTGAVEIIRDWSNSNDIFYIPSSHYGYVTGVLCFNTVWSGMMFTHEGLTQRLIQVQRTMHETPTNPDSGNINDPKDPRINTIMAAIQKLDTEEKEKLQEAKKTNEYAGYIDMYQNHQLIRKPYADQLFSIWRELGNFGFGYEMEDANKKCGVKPLDISSIIGK